MHALNKFAHARMRHPHRAHPFDVCMYVHVSQKNYTNVRSKMASFYVEAMVRGYHVYQDIWTVVGGEEFPCKREAGNTFDPFAVAVMRGTTVISHVPRRISSICSLFLRKEGSITCQVTGHRQFSKDLVHVQRGLEVPCVLHFEGDTKVSARAKKLVELALSTFTAVDLPASKKRKVTDTPTILSEGSRSEVAIKEWVQFSKGLVLTLADKERILAGEKLDHHIDFAQNLLKQQFFGGRRTTINTIAGEASEAMWRKQENDPNCAFLWWSLDCSNNDACYWWQSTSVQYCVSYSWSTYQEHNFECVSSFNVHRIGSSKQTGRRTWLQHFCCCHINSFGFPTKPSGDQVWSACYVASFGSMFWEETILSIPKCLVF